MATNSKGNNITKSVEMPPELWAEVEARFTKMRLGFSEYVRWLLERDLKERGVMVHSEDPGEAGIYPKHSPASLTLHEVLKRQGHDGNAPQDLSAHAAQLAQMKVELRRTAANKGGAKAKKG